MHFKGDIKAKAGKLKQGPADVLQGMDKRVRIGAVYTVKTDNTASISEVDALGALSGFKLHECGNRSSVSADVLLVDASSIALTSKGEFDTLISVLSPRWTNKIHSTSVENIARGIAEGLIEPWCPYFEPKVIKNMLEFQIKAICALRGHTVRDLGTLGSIPSLAEPGIMDDCYARYCAAYPEKKTRVSLGSFRTFLTKICGEICGGTAARQRLRASMETFWESDCLAGTRQATIIATVEPLEPKMDTLMCKDCSRKFTSAMKLEQHLVLGKSTKSACVCSSVG